MNFQSRQNNIYNDVDLVPKEPSDRNSISRSPDDDRISPEKRDNAGKMKKQCHFSQLLVQKSYKINILNVFLNVTY